ncbi:hypothetical protein WA026_021858 [Henosepilachna vigintioctopunctata]|uniref:Uncharacterized protein n=1 Tax=Henosepilachna vigintioctopunctata TaxID=420089 RepID=A0AAW1URR8_9CUCU
MSSYLCRLCSTNCSYEDSSLFSSSIIKMIEYCIPEFDIELVNNPIICIKCYDLLKQTESFKRKCLEVQESIRKQRQTTTSTNNEAVKSSTNDLLNVDTNLTQKIRSNLSFNESYKKFLTTGTENKLSNIIEDLESSESLGVKYEKKDNAIGNDEFLSLLDSSPNISTDVNTRKLLIGKGDSLQNFYDDNSQAKLDDSSGKSTKGKSKEVKTLEVIDNPLDVLFEKFCCITCELRLNNLNNLIRHLYTVHQKEGDLYTCILCRYKSQEFKGIRRHYQSVHINCVDLKSSCVYCAIDMPNYTLLYKHMRKEHAKYCLSDRFCCNSCDFRSRRYDTFRKHFFKSHDFICNYCCKSFDSLECLNRHIGHHSKSIRKKKR